MQKEIVEEDIKDTIFAILSKSEKSRFDFWIDEIVIDESGLLKQLVELKIGSNEDKAVSLNNRQLSFDLGTKDKEGQNCQHETEAYKEIEFERERANF